MPTVQELKALPESFPIIELKESDLSFVVELVSWKLMRVTFTINIIPNSLFKRFDSFIE